MNAGTRLMIGALEQLAASGKSVHEAAAELSASVHTVRRYAKVYGIGLKVAPRGRPCGSITAGPDARSEAMAALYVQGNTLSQIGEKFGVTRERVRQIITRHHGLTAKHGGATKIAKDARKKFAADRDARSMRKWGCPWSQYVLLRDMRKPTNAYNSQRQNAAKRGIEWKLTLWQWWTIWQESGHWEERGRGHGYQMCRLRDAGPYAMDNVYIATGAENMKDYWAHAERQTRPLRAPEEALELRRYRIRQYYYRRKFREAGIPEDQIAARVAQACPGLSA